MLDVLWKFPNVVQNVALPMCNKIKIMVTSCIPTRTHTRTHTYTHYSLKSITIIITTQIKNGILLLAAGVGGLAVLHILSPLHEFMAGPADSVGPLRGVPWQRGIAAGTCTTRYTATVAAVVLVGGEGEVSSCSHTTAIIRNHNHSGALTTTVIMAVLMHTFVTR